MKITDVSLFKVRGTYDGPYFPPGDRQAQAMDIYPEYNRESRAKRRSEGPDTITEIYLEILTDEGITGIFGPIEDYQAFIIHKFLRILTRGNGEILSLNAMQFRSEAAPLGFSFCQISADRPVFLWDESLDLPFSFDDKT